jgi:hypothetical protein
MTTFTRGQGNKLKYKPAANNAARHLCRFLQDNDSSRYPHLLFFTRTVVDAEGKYGARIAGPKMYWESSQCLFSSLQCENKRPLPPVPDVVLSLKYADLPCS